MKTTDNGIPGPTYLEGFTEHIANPDKLYEHEWRRRLKASNGNTKFKIKYYGEMHGKYNLIVCTDFSEMLVYAVEPQSNEEILVFDGCRHGYNAMLCDSYTDEQMNNRPVEKWYIDEDGNDLFEVIISTYNGIDFDDEFGEEADENGSITSDYGTMVSLDELKCNGFDFFQVFLISEKGREIELISEELA